MNKERKEEITVPFSQQKLSQWFRRGLGNPPKMASLHGSEEDTNYKTRMSGSTKNYLAGNKVRLIHAPGTSYLWGL